MKRERHYNTAFGVSPVSLLVFTLQRVRCDFIEQIRLFQVYYLSLTKLYSCSLCTSRASLSVSNAPDSIDKNSLKEVRMMSSIEFDHETAVDTSD